MMTPMKHLTPLLLLAACAAEPPRDEAREKLVTTHRELFSFLGLSAPAVDELCGKVGGVYDGMQKHAAEHPKEHAALAGVTQRGAPATREEAMAAHAERFASLGLTPGTQRELEAAFRGVYEDLRRPQPTERSLKIRTLMAQLPPCCDDNIFKRAGS